MKLLIDGYNVIPAIPELGRKLRSDLEEGREAFLSLLGEYKRISSVPLDITVVFDGKRNPGRDTTMRIHGIGVRFSRNEIADDLILRLLKNEMRGATLVTSDRALRAAAEPMAGTLARSGEFVDRLLLTMGKASGEGEPTMRPIQNSTKKKGNPRRLSKKERSRQRSLKKL